MFAPVQVAGDVNPQVFDCIQFFKFDSLQGVFEVYVLSFSTQSHYVALDGLKPHTILLCPVSEYVDVSLEYLAVFDVFNLSITHTQSSANSRASDDTFSLMSLM